MSTTTTTAADTAALLTAAKADRARHLDRARRARQAGRGWQAASDPTIRAACERSARRAVRLAQADLERIIALSLDWPA